VGKIHLFPFAEPFSRFGKKRSPFRAEEALAINTKMKKFIVSVF
jgi:hypothetical protein